MSLRFPVAGWLRGFTKPPERAKTKEKQMSREKLSTGCELSTASLKKREGEKRKSPLTPYREKGKGKEDKPSACSTGLFARTRGRARARRSPAAARQRGGRGRSWRWMCQCSLRLLQPQDMEGSRHPETHFLPQAEKSENIFSCLKTKGEVEVCKAVSWWNLALHPPFCRLLLRGHVVGR